MDLKASSQAYSGGKDTKYTWYFVVNGEGRVYRKNQGFGAFRNCKSKAIGFFLSSVSCWTNPPLGPPSENWLRERNRINSIMKTIYDRGKKDAY